MASKRRKKVIERALRDRKRKDRIAAQARQRQVEKIAQERAQEARDADVPA